MGRIAKIMFGIAAVVFDRAAVRHPSACFYIQRIPDLSGARLVGTLV